MKLKIIAIGRIRSQPVRQLVGEYSSRLAHYLPVEIIGVRDDDKALSKIEASDYLVLLDEGGDQLDSVALSQLISDHQRRGTKRMVMFIGSEDGAGAAIKSRTDIKLALSRMTFPHELVQVILLEQLYRACSMMKGEPYHRG